MHDNELARLASLEVKQDSAEAARLRTKIEVEKLSPDSCLALAKSLDDDAGSKIRAATPTLWHMYWKPSTCSGFHSAHAVAIEAWLVTQPDTAVLIMWVPVPEAVPSALLPLAQAFPGRIFFRALDMLWEAEGSPLARSYLLRLTDKYSWVDSDMVRMVILFRYGGFYTDIDVLLGRDVSPLLGLEFVTEFGCGGGINGAIMHTFAHSPLVTRMLEIARDTKPRLAMWTFGPFLLDRLRAETGAGAALVKLPWCFFHGIWCGNALPRDSLVGSSAWSSDYFSGIFGVHLHGAGKLGGPIVTTSLLGVRMRENRAVLEARLLSANRHVNLPPLVFDEPHSDKSWLSFFVPSASLAWLLPTGGSS